LNYSPDTVEAVLAGGGLILSLIVIIVALTRTPAQEREIIEREDKAMSRVSDDPSEPARWVP